MAPWLSALPHLWHRMWNLNKSRGGPMGQAEFTTVSEIRNPLLVMQRTVNIGYDELVEVMGPDEVPRTGRVVEVGHPGQGPGHW